MSRMGMLGIAIGSHGSEKERCKTRRFLSFNLCIAFLVIYRGGEFEGSNLSCSIELPPAIVSIEAVMEKKWNC